MNLSEQEVNTPQSTSGNYTEEIILRLEEASVKLNRSTGLIAERLTKMVGDDTYKEVENNKMETKASREGAYGQIHDIIDDIFATARINDENSEKLSRII